MFEIGRFFQKSFFIDKELAAVYQREKSPTFQKIALEDKRLLYSTLRHALPISLYLDLVYPKWRKKKNSLLGMSFLFLALEERIFGNKAIYHTYQWLNKNLSASRTEWLKPISRSILENTPATKESFYQYIDKIMRAEPYIAKLLSQHPSLEWTMLFEHPPLWIRCRNEAIASQIPIEDIVLQKGCALQLTKTSSTTTHFFEKGELSFQNIASQSLSQVLKALSLIKPNPKQIIEACAAPGGKSALILEHFLKNRKEMSFILTDLNVEKIQDLETNLNRIFPNLYHEFKGLKLQPHNWLQGPLNKKADLIFVDAPCSGSGVTRKHPDVLWKEPINSASNHAQTQYEIVKNALADLSEDGFLIYSTCSLDSDENENLLHRIFQEYPFLQKVSPGLQEGLELSLGHQILPCDQFDGLYIAILKKP